MRDTREAAMRRHPAGKGRIEQLIAEAQDRQAMDVANRGRAELEGWAGGPIPESPEVAQERMERAEERDNGGGGDCYGWLHVARAAIGVIGLYLIVVTSAVVGEMVAGWPL